MVSLTYKSSGVDIKKANDFVKAIQKDVAKTRLPSVILRKGSFGGLYELAKGNLRQPVLVSSTDGVGTKLLIAQMLNKHDTVGIDLVAMNVNDILCVGARPLFFLDYIACGKVKTKVLRSVVKGIAKGCQLSGLSLVGGETAEMPGMYSADEYDLAGFAVGVVEKNKIIDGSQIKAGDHVLGLPSSGIHSNGYSLVRKVFSLFEQRKLATELLRPTRIYAKEVLALTAHFGVKGIAHITGGAYYDKLTKILPSGLCFAINKGCWPVLPIFKHIQSKGKISDEQMYHTFNMGIGMAFVFAARDVARVKAFLMGRHIKFYDMGQVIRHKNKRIVFN